ncbi:MAG: ribonuclease R, partial [Rhizobiaceae bacterium]
MAKRIPGGRGGPVKSGSGPRVRHGELPDRETLLEWLRNNPGESTKRDIAKSFGIKGDDRVILKAMLRELAAEGALRKEGSRLIAPGGLPPVCALDVFARDKDGGLIARPVEWDETNGP